MNEPVLPVPGDGSQPKTSTLAIWSLVLGILAIVLMVVCIGFLFAIPAIICGHLAYSRIKRSDGQLAGAGLAIAGFITGYVSLALILLLLPIAIPNFVKARSTAQKNACVNNLRMIDAAKNQWALEGSKKPGDIPTAQDLKPYLKNGILPVCPSAGIYTIGAVSNVPTCSISGHLLSK